MRHLSATLGLILLLALLPALLPTAAAEPSFRVGAAVREIPPAGGGRSGDSRPRREVQAVVVEAEGIRVAIVSLDAGAIHRKLREAVLERLPAECGIDSDSLLLAATGAPAEPGAEPVNAITEAIRAAVEDLSPAELRLGRASLRGLVRNRQNPSGPVDEMLTVLEVRGEADRPKALLVFLAIEGASLPGALRAAIRERKGAGLPVLVLQGARILQEAEKPLSALTLAIADKVEEARLAARPLDEEMGVMAMMDPRPLPPTSPDAESRQKANVQVVLFGGLGLMTVPGEQTAAAGLRFRRRARLDVGREPDLHFALVCLANDDLGVFPTEREWREGRFPRSAARYGPEAWETAVSVLGFPEEPRGGGEIEDRDGVRLLTLWGAARDRGRAHGRLLKAEIRNAVRTHGAAGDARRLHRFLPEELIEEMKGIAEGAEVPYDEILLLNVHAAAPGEIAILVKPDRGHPFVSTGSPGLVGVFSAVNTEGVAVSMEAPAEVAGETIPVPMLIRDAIGRSSTLDMAAERTRGFPVTVTSSDLLLPGEPYRLLDLEKEVGDWAAESPIPPVSIEPLAPPSPRKGFRVQRVWFTSAEPSGQPENDRFPVEHYVPEKPSRGAVIVLPIWRGGILLAERIVAAHLASGGYEAAIVPLPYQFQRAPRGVGSGAWTVSSDLERTKRVMEQALADVRSVTDWLRARESVAEGRVGVLGISLGAHVAAVAYQRDPRLRAGVFVMAGGDPASMVWAASKETRRMKRELVARGVTLATLREYLEPLDPAGLAGEQPYPGFPRYRGVLMVNGTEDTVIPPENARRLHRALGEPEIVWLPVNHYSMATKIREILDLTDRHLDRMFR